METFWALLPFWGARSLFAPCISPLHHRSHPTWTIYNIWWNYYWATGLISLSAHVLAQAAICFPIVGHLSSLKKLDFGGRLCWDIITWKEQLKDLIKDTKSMVSTLWNLFLKDVPQPSALTALLLSFFKLLSWVKPNCVNCCVVLKHSDLWHPRL